MGKPVIGARIGGIPELVEEGASGWLFKSGDERELADVLRQVAGAPDWAVAALGRSARAIALSRFSKAGYLEATRELYSRLAVI
jgi:glycosyltransferase involved in cell wall biosynthesis